MHRYRWKFVTLLALGVLAGGARMAHAQTFSATPSCGSTIDFNLDSEPDVFLRNTGADTLQFSVSVTGPNAADFTGSFTFPPSLTGQGARDILAFHPSACGTETATLTVTVFDVTRMMTVGTCSYTLTGGVSCPSCSFSSAINAAQSASLSATGSRLILNDLFNAAATTGMLRCYYLKCALCLAQTEAAAGRAGAADLVSQIQCLQGSSGC